MKIALLAPVLQFRVRIIRIDRNNIIVCIRTFYSSPWVKMPAVSYVIPVWPLVLINLVLPMIPIQKLATQHWMPQQLSVATMTIHELPKWEFEFQVNSFPALVQVVTNKIQMVHILKLFHWPEIICVFPWMVEVSFPHTSVHSECSRFRAQPPF